MTPGEVEAVALAIVKRLAPHLTAPLRMNRKRMAAAIDVSSRTLQGWTNREADPCPCTRIDSLVLYDPRLVGEWLARQQKCPAGRPGEGKDGIHGNGSKND